MNENEKKPEPDQDLIKSPEKSSGNGPSSPASKSKKQESTSLWEMMGRGVGKGLKAAKNLGETISNEAVKASNQKEVEEDLDSHYRILGRMVAEQFLDWKKDSISKDDPAISKLVEEIRKQLEELE